MMRALSILGCLLAFPAMAGGVYHVGGKCRPAAIHTPDASVEAKPGMDIHGREVMPADVNAPPMDIEALKNPPIALNLPIDRYLDERAYNVDLRRAEIQPGVITQGENGQLKLNNEILSTGPQEVYPEGCE